MANKSVFKKSFVIGIILLFIGASVVPSICGNVEEKNERYRNTQPAIFNGDNSKGWNITEVVSTESTNWSWRPSLMVDTDSVVHIAWMDYTDYGGSGSDIDIFYKYKNNGGSWSTTEVVSTESTEDSGYPSLMVDTDSVVHVAWQDHTEYGGAGSDTDIFYKYKSGGNEPPNKPEIEGPVSGKAGISYDYTFTSADPDGDNVSYYIKWGDGGTTDWTTFQASGPPGHSESHTWDEQGTYTIEAKAKDTFDVESEWADFLIVIKKDEKPPNINITKPERGLYFFDKKIRDYLLRFRTPLIIGRVTIEVNATDEDSGIEKVEFYINGKYMRNDTSFPYEFDWRWTRPRLFHLFIIKVIAYDNAGNNATKRMVVRKFL